MKPISVMLRTISKKEAEEELRTRENRGDHIDRRLRCGIKAACILLSGCLQDEESFLSLIWHEINDSRLLTPCGSRTLKDVVQRMIEEDWCFKDLCSNLGLPAYKHNPCWFERCVRIDKCFDHSRLGWIAVTTVSDSIYSQSPEGSLYIYDGCHKALVYAHRLLTDKESYRPTPFLWLVTRHGLDDLPSC